MGNLRGVNLRMSGVMARFGLGRNQGTAID